MEDVEGHAEDLSFSCRGGFLTKAVIKLQGYKSYITK
jgi:hypothetical protein